MEILYSRFLERESGLNVGYVGTYTPVDIYVLSHCKYELISLENFLSFSYLTLTYY